MTEENPAEVVRRTWSRLPDDFPEAVAYLRKFGEVRVGARGPDGKVIGRQERRTRFVEVALVVLKMDEAGTVTGSFGGSAVEVGRVEP